MSRLPDEIAGKTFSRRCLGYAPYQVRGFLERVSTDYTAATDRISQLAEDLSHTQHTASTFTDELATLTRQARHAEDDPQPTHGTNSKPRGTDPLSGQGRSSAWPN